MQHDYKKLIPKVYPESLVYNDRDSVIETGDIRAVIMGQEKLALDMYLRNLVQYNQRDQGDCTIFWMLTACTNLLDTGYPVDDVMVRANRFMEKKWWDHPTKKQLGGTMELMEYIFPGRFKYSAIAAHQALDLMKNWEWAVVSDTNEKHVYAVHKIQDRMWRVDNFSKEEDYNWKKYNVTRIEDDYLVWKNINSLLKIEKIK